MVRRDAHIVVIGVMAEDIVQGVVVSVVLAIAEGIDLCDVVFTTLVVVSNRVLARSSQGVCGSLKPHNLIYGDCYETI